MHSTRRADEKYENKFKNKTICLKQLKIWIILDIRVDKYTEDYRFEGRDAA
jgi:hypothetical protein